MLPTSPLARITLLAAAFALTLTPGADAYQRPGYHPEWRRHPDGGQAPCNLGAKVADGIRREYSHLITVNPDGGLVQTTTRRLGDREVTEAQVDGKSTRRLNNLGEDQLAEFEAEWTGQPAKPKTAVQECVKQRHADGTPVDVMVLSPGQTRSDSWLRANVESMSCDGKYALKTPNGQTVAAALPTGILDEHLRQPKSESKSELEANVIRAAKVLEDAKRELAEERAHKAKAAQQAQREQAREKAKRLDEELEAINKRYNELTNAKKKLGRQLQDLE